MAAAAFQPAGKRRRQCSSCPRGRNGHRHRRSARARPRMLAHDLLVDRGDVGGRGDLGVGEIEISTALKNNVSFCSFSTEETPTPSGISKTKRTKVGCTEARTRIGGRFLAAASVARWTQRALGRAGPIGQFPDHVRRQARRRTGPGIGQKVDEQPFAGGHGIDGDPARQRQADGHAVGIAPRRADIIGHGVRDRFDGTSTGCLKRMTRMEPAVVTSEFDIVGEFDHQPGIAAGRRKRRLALDRIALARADAMDPSRISSAATSRKARRPRQRRGRTAREARHSDQNPAAAIRAISLGFVFRGLSFAGRSAAGRTRPRQ